MISDRIVLLLELLLVKISKLLRADFGAVLTDVQQAVHRIISDSQSHAVFIFLSC